MLLVSLYHKHIRYASHKFDNIYMFCKTQDEKARVKILGMNKPIHHLCTQEKIVNNNNNDNNN